VLGACPIRRRGPLLLIFSLPPSHVLARLHHFACVMTFLCSRAFSWVMIPRSRDFAAVCRGKSKNVPSKFLAYILMHTHKAFTTDMMCCQCRLTTCSSRHKRSFSIQHNSRA
jgi:hypothetical protein